MTLKGACTEEDFARESKRIEAEIRDLGRLAPAPVSPAFDTVKLVVHITRTFARFRKQPFDEKRDVLRTVFREIVLEDGTIPCVTINGAFLDCANSAHLKAVELAPIPSPAMRIVNAVNPASRRMPRNEWRKSCAKSAILERSR